LNKIVIDFQNDNVLLDWKLKGRVVSLTISFVNTEKSYSLLTYARCRKENREIPPPDEERVFSN
jgi:hypothetical protein